jgi:hypothetical protein
MISNNSYQQSFQLFLRMPREALISKLRQQMILVEMMENKKKVFKHLP